MYETRDSFTRFPPPEGTGLIKYVEVEGRTKIAIKHQISEYIPKPSFEVVAAPASPAGLTSCTATRKASRGRDLLGRAMKAENAFFSPEPSASPA